MWSVGASVETSLASWRPVPSTDRTWRWCRWLYSQRSSFVVHQLIVNGLHFHAAGCFEVSRWHHVQRRVARRPETRQGRSITPVADCLCLVSAPCCPKQSLLHAGCEKEPGVRQRAKETASALYSWQKELGTSPSTYRSRMLSSTSCLCRVNGSLQMGTCTRASGRITWHMVSDSQKKASPATRTTAIGHLANRRAS